MQLPRIHPDSIEDLKQRIDIYDIISEHVVLRKRGKDYQGLCPFHEEKSPSFTVSTTRQMYHCFGCGAAGNAIKFLMEIGKQNFAEVIMDLARRYQVPLKTLEPEQREELQKQVSLREELYEIIALASSFYQHALWQSNHGPNRGLEYLQDERKFSKETIQDFQLGYAPSGWDMLYSYLIEQKHLPLQLVEKAGLIVPRKSGGGYYDRFRDRLMIPINDSQGRTIAFGGRILTDEQPKYLNSPETELFTKGKNLFALDRAKNSISKLDNAIVVEGYFDAIALHSAGITNVVASLGTALSVEQIRLLLRYTESKSIVFNFDADQAGIKATERAIGEIANLAYQGTVQLKILNLPNGKDADEFLYEHRPEAYQELINNSPLWIDWQIQQLIKDKDLKKAEISQKIIQTMVELLSKLINGNQRTHYLQKCADLLSQGDSRLVPITAQNLQYQLKRKYWQQKQANNPKKPRSLAAIPNPLQRRLLEYAEGTLLRICIHCPEYQIEVQNALSEQELNFSLSHHRFLWQVMLHLQKKQIPNDQLISALQNFYLEYPEQMQYISHLFQMEETAKGEILRVPLVIRGAIACLERVGCEKRYRYFRDLWEKTNVSLNPELARSYYEKLAKEKKRITELDEILRCTTFYDLVSIPWIET